MMNCSHCILWLDDALWPCKQMQPGSVSVKVLRASRPAITPGMNHGNVKYKVCHRTQWSVFNHNILKHKATTVHSWVESLTLFPFVSCCLCMKRMPHPQLWPYATKLQRRTGYCWMQVAACCFRVKALWSSHIIMYDECLTRTDLHDIKSKTHLSL